MHSSMVYNIYHINKGKLYLSCVCQMLFKKYCSLCLKSVFAFLNSSSLSVYTCISSNHVLMFGRSLSICVCAVLDLLFYLGSVLNEEWTCSDLYRFQSGLSPLEQNSRYTRVYGVIILCEGSGSPALVLMNYFFVYLRSRQQVYGPNLITVPVKSYMSLLVDEVRRRRNACTRHPLASVVARE